MTGANQLRELYRDRANPILWGQLLAIADRVEVLETMRDTMDETNMLQAFDCVFHCKGINPKSVPVLQDALLQLVRDVHSGCSREFTERLSVKAAKAALVLSNTLAEKQT